MYHAIAIDATSIRWQLQETSNDLLISLFFSSATHFSKNKILLGYSDIETLVSWSYKLFRIKGWNFQDGIIWIENFRGFVIVTRMSPKKKFVWSLLVKIE